MEIKTLKGMGLGLAILASPFVVYAFISAYEFVLFGRYEPETGKRVFTAVVCGFFTLINSCTCFVFASEKSEKQAKKEILGQRRNKKMPGAF